MSLSALSAQTLNSFLYIYRYAAEADGHIRADINLTLQCYHILVIFKSFLLLLLLESL